MNSKNHLINIMGPTGVGKTSFSLKVAQEFEAEIFSSDSRQIFKEMSIGTAVPDKKELEQVKHHFIQSHSIKDNYSAGAYEREIIASLENYYQTKHCALLVGGTGLYIDAVIKGLDKFPEISKEIEQEVEAWFETEGLQRLQAELQKRDPEYYQSIDQQNPRRIIRALKVVMQSNKSFLSFTNQIKPKRNFQIHNIILERDRTELYDRINQRVDLMISAGLLDEVKDLIPFSALRSLQTVGYQELFAHLANELSLEEAIEEIKKNTRRYAKRQITWLKKYEALRIHPNEIQTALTFLKEKMAIDKV